MSWWSRKKQTQLDKSQSGASTKSFLWLESGAVGGVGNGSARDLAANSIVMACIHWAMRNAVQADAAVVDDPNGSEPGYGQPLNHPLARLLAAPQGQLPPDQRTALNGARLIQSIVWSLLLDGNAYVQKLRDDRGRVVGLEWLPPLSVDPVPAAHHAGVVAFYRVETPRGPVEMDPADLVHFRDGIDATRLTQGQSRVRAALRHVMTDNHIAVFTRALLQNPVPALMVTPKGEDAARLTAEDAREIARQLTERHRGERAGGVLVPNFPADVTPLGYSPDQMAISRLNRLPEERITAVIGLPAVVVGMGAGLDRATYANFKEARRVAFEEFLVPLWQDLADAWTEQLLPEFDQTLGRRVVYDTRSVMALRDDTDAQWRRAREAFAAGLIDRATARRMMGLAVDPRDDGVFAGGVA